MIRVYEVVGLGAVSITDADVGAVAQVHLKVKIIQYRSLRGHVNRNSLTWPENWWWEPIFWLWRQQPAKLKARWPVAMEAATAASVKESVVTCFPLSLHHCIIFLVISPEQRHLLHNSTYVDGSATRLGFAPSTRETLAVGPTLNACDRPLGILGVLSAG